MICGFVTSHLLFLIITRKGKELCRRYSLLVFYFGDIKSENLGDLWNSEFLGYFRGKNKYKRCDPCNRWEDCLGGCRAMALLATGRLDSSDPFCAFWNRSPNNK
jgi:radical SAM protein with 4Fe4S-binding SPASM domain